MRALRRARAAVPSAAAAAVSQRQPRRGNARRHLRQPFRQPAWARQRGDAAGHPRARRMAQGCGGTASHELCLLVVLNSASIQLLPTTVAGVRSALGSADPFDILPTVWTASLLSVLAGLAAAKLFARIWRG